MNLSQAFCRPSSQYFLGCDIYGQSLSIVIFNGLAYSVTIAVLASFMILILALVYGLTVLIKNHKIRIFFEMFLQALLLFPPFLLALLISTLIKQTWFSLVLTLCLTQWPTKAFYLQQLIQHEINKNYLDSAKAIGATDFRVFIYYILPALKPIVALEFCQTLATVFLLEASLSYLGLGTSNHLRSIGTLVYEGRDYLIEAPHLSLFPGLFFICFIILINFIAQKITPSNTMKLR